MSERFNFLHISDLHFATGAAAGASKTKLQRFGDLLDRFIELQYSGKIPHICPLPLSSVDYLAAERLAQIVADRVPVTDFVLVTGDVANTGGEADLRRARDFFEGILVEPSRPSGSIFNISANTPVIFVPGNHDRFSGWARKPGGTQYDKVFGREWAIPSKYTTLKRGIRITRFSKPNADLVICAADFTLPRGTYHDIREWLGQGRVSERKLRALVAVTRDARKEERAAVIWAVHFPPLARKAALRLQGDARLIQAAEECGIQMLFCGHDHDQYHFAIGSGHKKTEVAVAGTATQREMGLTNTFFSVSLEIDKGRINSAHLSRYRRNEGAGDFTYIGTEEFSA
jgi:hypothetical protein